MPERVPVQLAVELAFPSSRLQGPRLWRCHLRLQLGLESPATALPTNTGYSDSQGCAAARQLIQSILHATHLLWSREIKSKVPHHSRMEIKSWRSRSIIKRQAGCGSVLTRSQLDEERKPVGEEVWVAGAVVVMGIPPWPAPATHALHRLLLPFAGAVVRRPPPHVEHDGPCNKKRITLSFRPGSLTLTTTTTQLWSRASVSTYTQY